MEMLLTEQGGVNAMIGTPSMESVSMAARTHAAAWGSPDF